MTVGWYVYEMVWFCEKIYVIRKGAIHGGATTESVIAGLAEAVQKAQDLARPSTEPYFNDRVQTLIALSTALHKILRDEQES